MKKKIFQINIEKNGPIAGPEMQGLKWSRARDNVRYVPMQKILIGKSIKKINCWLGNWCEI